MKNNRQDVLAKDLLAASGNNLEQAMDALKRLQQQRPQTDYVPKNSEVVVRVEKLAKHYRVGRNNVNALQGVDIAIHKSEFVAITGTSGSGKSTLLHMLAGLDRPSSGTIMVGDQNIAKLRDGKLATFRNQTIGFVFQFFYLQPFLNLQTNIEVPAIFARTKRSVRHLRSKELATTVGLEDRLHHLPRELSGGQMQRAAIARALQNQPSILLADEPTGNLDHANALAIFDLFKQIRDEHGTTVIVVTHDNELARAADRIINMRDGVVI